MSGRFKALLLGCLAAAILMAPAHAADAALQVGAKQSWPEYVRALFPVFLVVAGLITTGLLLGLATRFPTVAAFNSLKTTVEKLETKVTSHDRRIQSTESYCSGSPSRLELQEDISELGERIKGVETEMAGANRQLGTMNTYLHSLIDRGLHRS